MHREPLLAILEVYLERFPEDRVRADHIRQFVRTHSKCFERSCTEGHITSSAWITSRDYRQVLLTHHRKLETWLQLGGHADGDPDPARVARREAEEESGLSSLEPFPSGVDLLPFDVDVHLIPPYRGEPAHLHHDLRYLFTADSGEPLRISAESKELRWFALRELEKVSGEGSLLRMARKAREVVGTKQS